MATSGTVATTTIDTSALLEHAFRRCKVLPSAQTPETVLIAKECLYMLLLNMGNRGLNLWAVEKAFIGLNAGQATYTTPAGTLDVLNVIYSQPTLVTATFAAIAEGGKASFTSSAVTRVGAAFGAAFTGAVIISTSTDDISYAVQTTSPSASYATGSYYWFDLPTITTAAYVKVTTVSPYPTITDIQVATASYDLPCSQWNRDTYAAMPNKLQQGRPSTNYFFEKKLTPTLTMWPVPNNSTDHLTIYRHRQPQDVGTLTQQLEIPQRWLDGFIWLLAARLCFELPSVPDTVINIVVQMADKQVFEAEQSETDGAPIFLTPGIGVYTR
jgi:hypothetical protein